MSPHKTVITATPEAIAEALGVTIEQVLASGLTTHQEFDYDAVWMLDYEGNETDDINGAHVYAKAEYPTLRVAQEHFRLWTAERERWREQSAAATRRRRGRPRKEQQA